MKEQQQQPRETKSLNLNCRKPGWRLAVQCCGLLATLALSLAVAPRAVATITVTTLDDNGPGSLRQAIADAPPGETIDFAVTGTITLTNGELAIDKNLIITGPGRTNLTVSGNDASRVFNINSASAVVAMSDLAIINGDAGLSAGGGILNMGNLTISNCIVSHCIAVMAGAGILSGDSSTLRVVNSIVSNNSSWSGGGWGTGIACPWYNIQLTIINSTISSNYNPSGGGAIMLGNGGVGAITNTTFSGNAAGGAGGAIYLQYATSLTLDSCTIASNSAGEYGGGGIHNYDAFTVVNMRNSVLAGNTANSGPDCLGPIASHDCNLIGSTAGATITGATTHNIYGQDPLLGPLADNGGPTPTHALLPGSPAIDRGSGGGVTTDQRGQPRILNFPAYFDAADGSDIGAYELQERAQTGPTFTVNTTDDTDDSVPGIAHCSLREALSAASANSDSNSIIFATSVPGLMTGVSGTIVLTNGQLLIGTDLSIKGPGSTQLTLSGNHSSRILSVLNASFVALNDLTLADGHAIGPNTGAGESYGGGIHNRGTLSINRCTLRGNTADEFGGAIWGGTLTIINSLLHSNTAPVGGAICNSGNAKVIGSCISSNSAGLGGAIWGVFGGSVTCLTNCTLSGNVATGYAGAIGNASGADVYIDSSTICSNSAAVAGGGISLQGAYDDIFTIRNSIVAGNSAPTGPDVSGNQGLISQDYNLIQNTNGSAIIGVTTHNIYGQDPLLGALTNNGGSTLTHALLPGSPAIDQGSGGGLAADQRGQPRPVDFPDLANAGDGDGSDIGAYEVRDLPQTGPVFTVNSNDDIDDGVPGVLHCSLREAIANATPGGTIDFAVTGTITLTSGELVITNDLTIAGPGATSLAISGNNASRVFRLSGTGNTTISGLTITKGNGGSYYGGGGSGIYTWGPTLLVRDCLVTGNEAGSGIGNVGGILRVLGSTISSNYPGIYNWAGEVHIVSSSVLDNQGYDQGGGIDSTGFLALTNCTVSGNAARHPRPGEGGGMVVQGTGIIVSSTICSNWGIVGGGVAFYNGQVSLLNSIVANNHANSSGPDLYTSDPSATLVSLDYNLIGDTNGANITGVATHNIYGKDPLLGPLADNGGPTPTHALLPGSPAIDHGSSGGLATDQRGQPRIFNFPAYFDADDGSDIGAYELQERAQTGPVFTVNANDDVDDGLPGIAHCSLREAINAANANSDSNSITFATSLPGLMTGVTGTIVLTNGQLSAAKNNGELSILGPGAACLTISGNHSNRVLQARVTLLTVSGLTFADGYAPGDAFSTLSSGGAISSFNSVGEIVINRCTFKGNVAGAYGGAVYQNSGFLTIAESIFQNNEALGNDGGAIACLSASVNGSCIFSNTAGNGGAIVVWAGETAQLTNCTLTANTALGNGGGVFSYSGSSVYVDSCTISSNQAAAAGGGIGTIGEVHIRNSILAGNSTVSCTSGPDVYGSIVSDDYNLIQNPTNEPGGVIGLTAHNIYNQDPKLGPLADLGGPTPTHALRFDSPALDAGHSGGLTTDQRGLPRPIDSPDIANAAGGDGSDIGAYEADPNPRISGFGKTGGDIWLSFNSLLGRTYRVETTDELPPTWSVLTNGVIGTGGRFQTVDGGAANLPKRFYRTVMLP